MAEDAGRRRLVGAEAIAAALDAGEALRLVITAREGLSPAARAVVERARGADIPVQPAGDPVLWRLTAGAPDAELLGLVGPPPGRALDAVLRERGALWLLAGTAYPGNAGFVIRTAEVSGADGVVIDAAFDRAKRRESLRASMRADRYLPVFFEKAAEVARDAARAGRRVIAIETHGRRAPWELDLTGPVCFVLGGERSGIPEPVLDAADEVVRIPMAGFIASYNLQAAMAAVAAERLRQSGLPGAAPGR